MLLDELTLFSDAQAVAADAVSTNVIDLGGDFNVGRGKDVYVHISLDVAADDTTGDETYEVELQTDSVENFASLTKIGSLVIPAGSPAGYHDVLRIPNNNERYLRLNYNVGGTTPTMTITAWVSGEAGDSWEAAPANTGL